MNKTREVLHKVVIYIEREIDGILVEIAMQYNDGYNEQILLCEQYPHTEGGTHLSGFVRASRTVNDYARKQGLLKENEENLTGEDVRGCCTAVISVRIHDPQFEGRPSRS